MGDPGDPDTEEGGETATHRKIEVNFRVLEAYDAFEKKFSVAHKETNWSKLMPTRFSDLCNRVEFLGEELRAFAAAENLGPLPKVGEGEHDQSMS